MYIKSWQDNKQMVVQCNDDSSMAQYRGDINHIGSHNDVYAYAFFTAVHPNEKWPIEL